MKKITAIILSLTMLLSTAAIAAERDITVSVDGERLSFDVPPQIIDGRTMVPIRAIFEAIGAEVSWDDATKTALCEKGNTKVSMTVGNKAETVNDKVVEMDIAPVVIDNRILAPARYVAEAFGYSVVWNGTLKTIIIASNEFKKENKYDDVSEQTIQIQQFINQKMYIEARDLCNKTKTEKALSPADAMLVEELLENAQSSYNSYLTKSAFDKVNSYMNSKMYLEAIAACDEAIDKTYISEQDNIKLKEIKAEAQAKYSVYRSQAKTLVDMVDTIDNIRYIMSTGYYLEAIEMCNDIKNNQNISQEVREELDNLAAEAAYWYDVYATKKKTKEQIVGKWTCVTDSDPLMKHHAIDIQFKNDGTFTLKTWRTKGIGTYSVILDSVSVDYSEYFNWAGTSEYQYEGECSTNFEIDGDTLIEYDDYLNITHIYYRGWTNQ